MKRAIGIAYAGVLILYSNVLSTSDQKLGRWLAVILEPEAFINVIYGADGIAN